MYRICILEGGNMRKKYLLSCVRIGDVTQWRLAFPTELALRSNLNESETYEVQWTYEAPGVYRVQIVGKRDKRRVRKSGNVEK